MARSIGAAFPRFDSPACFAALLVSQENGRWKIAPSGEVGFVTRTYRDSTMVLETRFETGEVTAVLFDFMPVS